MADFQFNDYSAKVKAQFEKNVKTALEAAGELQNDLARKEILRQPKFGDIPGVGAVDTGKMINSNEHEVNISHKEVIVGNTAFSDRGAPYPLYVTMGTRKMPPRHWFQNSILNHKEKYEQALSEKLSEGVE